MTVKCRACKQPKWSGDVCPNVNCSKAVSPAYRLTSHMTPPVTAMYQHGYHEESIMRQNTLDSIDNAADVLPETATMHAINGGQAMPYDAIRERRMVLTSTYRWWDMAHDNRTEYHQNFPGYCPRCTREKVGN